jgi:hypothetical protein
VADNGACVVWKVTRLGAVTPFAGVPSTCSYNGGNIPAAAAYLNTPYGLRLDFFENLYIADSGNNRIRKVDPTGAITTVVGNGNSGFSGDGWTRNIRQPQFSAGRCSQFSRRVRC